MRARVLSPSRAKLQLSALLRPSLREEGSFSIVVSAKDRRSPLSFLPNRVTADDPNQPANLLREREREKGSSSIGRERELPSPPSLTPKVIQPPSPVPPARKKRQ